MPTLKLEKAPQLTMKSGRWCMSTDFAWNGEMKHVNLIIDHSWDGECWDRYKIEVWDDGEDFEVVSKEEWLDRFQAVLENEGEAEAFKWRSKETVRPSTNGIEKHASEIGNSLISRWESMQELQLFVPGVTL